MIVQMRPIGSIRPYENNPRNNDGAVEAVIRSIREYGWRQPIVVDSDGIIIVGHTRHKAAIAMGLQEVPVHVAADLPPDKARAYRIADNRVGEIAEWEPQSLSSELAALEALGVEMDALGWEPDDLREAMGKDTEIVEDEPPAPLPDPVSKTGDLWILGEHRLLCGDSTKSEDVSRVMGGARASMVFTDPPWNVGIGMDSNPRHRQREGLVNDSMGAEEFGSFLRGFISAMAPHLDGDLYCVLGASEWPALDTALRSCGFHWSATVIWVKDLFVLGRSKYHRRYEPIWYGW